jgi:hypothetical protein
MFGGIIAIILLTILALGIAANIKKRYPVADIFILKRIIFFHWVMSLAYFLYVLFNRSDSYAYFKKAASQFKGGWMDYYGTSTTFIEWLVYPFVNYLNFTYEASMALFAFFGMLGFFYFHVFFKERIPNPTKVQGISLTTLFLFLPNMHFWSGSLGKGSVIFLGIALYFFGLNRPGKRLIHLLIGGLIIYHVRPHVMMVILISTAIGVMFSTKGAGLFARLAMLTLAIIAFFFIYQDVLQLVGIEEEEFLSEGLDLTHRAKELTKAGSAIDITNYSLPFQLFAFLYRPLFIDIPSAFGFFVSIENLFYLVLTWQFVFKGGIRFLLRGDFITKTAFLSFITVSIALAQISGNLGLAIRQKSQVMMLFMFVIAYFFQERQQKLRGQRLRRPRQVPEPGGVPS